MQGLIPTEEQKALIEAKGLIPSAWNVLAEDDKALTLISKNGNHTKVIFK